MELSELTPDHIENATTADIEALGLPPDVLAVILERGINFKWDSAQRRYVAKLPRKPRKP